MTFDRIREFHQWLRSQSVADTFTLFTRILLGIGFIPPGMTKVLGNPFTIISPETPIGAFFEAFFQAGVYYQFVGFGQVLAGLLLFSRRTSLWGALLYLPIISNILVITWSMGFRGTWVIVTFMLIANLYLLFWHWDRLQALFVSGRLEIRTESEWLQLRVSTPQNELLRIGGAALFVGLSCLGILMAVTRGYLPDGAAVVSICLGTAMAPALGAAVWELLRSRFRTS